MAPYRLQVNHIYPTVLMMHNGSVLPGAGAVVLRGQWLYFSVHVLAGNQSTSRRKPSKRDP